MFSMVCLDSSLMPPGTSFNVPGWMPICPESSSVLSMRTASASGTPAGYTLPEFRNSGDAGGLASAPRDHSRLVTGIESFCERFMEIPRGSGRRFRQPLLELDGVFDTAVVTLADRELVVAGLGVEIARAGIDATALDHDALHAGNHGHLLQPAQQLATHSAPAVFGPHAEQQQVSEL